MICDFYSSMILAMLTTCDVTGASVNIVPIKMYGPHAEGMSDAFAAAQVHNVKAEVLESIIGLKQCGMGIGTVELEQKNLERESKLANKCSSPALRTNMSKSAYMTLYIYLGSSKSLCVSVIHLWAKGKLRQFISIVDLPLFQMKDQ